MATAARPGYDRAVRGVRAAAGVLLSCLALPAGASAGTLETVTFPSRYVDAGKVALGAPPPGGAARPNSLAVNVLLPDGYAEHPTRRYPVLYLLHGAAQAYDHWAADGYGEIPKRAKDFPGIIVMPQGGVIGFYSDWVASGGPRWESYYLRELLPAVEARYRVRPGRRWHAIAGLSMGGYGTMYLAGQRPDYFGSAASFSGVLSPQDDQQLDLAAQLILGAAIPGFHYRDIFGPPEGFNAIGHNPSLTVGNLAATRLFASAGNGTPCPGDDPAPTNFTGLGPQGSKLFDPPLSSAEGPGLFYFLETLVRPETERFIARAEAAGLKPAKILGCGIHWWDTFNREFDAARKWDFFAPPPTTPTTWTFTTAERTGTAWGLRFTLDRAPSALTVLERAGRRLSGTGTGTLRISARGGCRLTVVLPFDRRLPRRCA